MEKWKNVRIIKINFNEKHLKTDNHCVRNNDNKLLPHEICMRAAAINCLSTAAAARSRALLSQWRTARGAGSQCDHAAATRYVLLLLLLKCCCGC